MTRREPDWADEAAREIVEKQYGDPEDFPEMRRDIAAALRAERERCAGLCRAEIEPGPETDTQFDQGWVAGAGFIRDRIRAGDQPPTCGSAPMREGER